MTKTSAYKYPLPLIVIYCITTAFFIIFKEKLAAWGVDQPVLLVGNMILFAVSLFSLFLYRRAMAHPNTTGFLKNTYSGLFLKLLTCIFAIMLYVFLAKDKVNKPAIFGCIVLYFLYTLLEMRSLMQWNKDRKNA